MPKRFKTVGGEVHGRCGLVFGPEPTEVDDETLATVTRRDGVEQTIGNRLLADPRLIPVEPENAGEPDTDDGAGSEGGGAAGEGQPPGAKGGKSGKGKKDGKGNK
jgi:hypothetical protein